jgi:radical SAM superfamily enzyme
MNKYVENMKKLAEKYGFKIAETSVGTDLICKNTDGKDFGWIKYNQNTDTVTLVGNTDQCNLWLGETRPDLTPERIIEFVKDLNEALEMETPYKLKDLIDGED